MSTLARNRNGSFIAWTKLVVLSAVGWPVGYAVKLLLLVLAVPINLGLALGSALGGRGSHYDFTDWSGRNAVLVPNARWLWLWGNDADGIDGPTEATAPNLRRWVERAEHWPTWRRILSWNLVRNSVANLRLSRFAVRVDPVRIEWVGNAASPRGSWLADSAQRWWCFSRQGWRTGLYIIRAVEGATTRLGWGLYPAPPPDRPLEWVQSVETQLWRKP